MDLFVAAGLTADDPALGGGPAARRAPSRTLRVPLFNHRVVEEAESRAVFDPSPASIAAARAYAKKARSPKFAGQKETAIRPLFLEGIVTKVLGYSRFDPEGYSLAFEWPIRRGFVDVALGEFGRPGAGDAIVAPLEVKGPGTRDLDAVPPGERRSPVQQAWDYAIDAPGSRWVLVCNCLELRLYGFGRGREAFELFDLTRLDERDEHRRLWLLLAAERLLGGETDALLAATDSVLKAITDDLYRDYSALRGRLIQFLGDSADGPKLPLSGAIEQAQKVLDRILFVAFAQRTELLPGGLLERAVEAHNPFDPAPLWSNFHGLFRYLDKGHFDLDISAYNGGLFAPDPIADTVVLPAHLAKDLAKLGEWDYRSDVPVTVLGHIFEQSITDLEQLRAASEGRPAPAISKRKREGVVYTPDAVTRFLVERTVGLSLSERFAALLARHAEPGASLANGAAIRWRDGRDSERAFWRDYAGALRSLTIVDPACGSGAFLVAVFDLLAAEYRRVVERLADLGEPADFDPFDEIVTKNLHGVDLNAESVEITRLSLWLKTARRKHALQNLEATIKAGNSLIEDGRFTERPFDWRAAFPHVFDKGGFDVVIGNPPYVRMELIKPVKPYLEEHYAVAADRADLYAYFFERGLKLLREGGRLGYISSSTFFRTGSGENLRRFLASAAAVETVVDFGEAQVFEGVTTYPAIVTMRRGAADPGGELSFLTLDDLPKDIGAPFDAAARPMRRARLGAGTWRFEEEPLARLRDKIAAGRRTLGEVYGAPLYGIKTGLNAAFVIDRPTRERLVAADPQSADLLVPFLRGEDVKRWRVEPRGWFLINTPKGKVDIEAYPAVRDWLLPFRPELEKRATQQAWFELQQAQLAYQARLGAAKIVWPHFQRQASFALDRSDSFLNNKCFFLSANEPFLASLLNSACAWFQLGALARIKRGGYIEAEAQYLADLALPAEGEPERVRLAALGEACGEAAGGRLAVQSAVRHRLLEDFSEPRRPIRFTRKLERWWSLDFKAFRAELRHVFRADIPVKERAQWERYLAENGAEIRRLAGEIAAAEREIDAVVYRLFDLTGDEIALLEASLAGQR